MRLYVKKPKKEVIYVAVKPVEKMTKRELKDEINAIEWQISESSSGRWELQYRESLYAEANKRGYTLKISKAYSFD